ncbi:unnamed protein product, partial [Discosporangium mesarthrocarpum]
MPVKGLVERAINSACGRWLLDFNKENVDVSVKACTITLSNLSINPDELCMFAPTFAPRTIHVGRFHVDFPLSLMLTRPVKVTVSEVMVLLSAGIGQMTEEEVRRAITAQIHLAHEMMNLAEVFPNAHEHWGLEERGGSSGSRFGGNGGRAGGGVKASTMDIIQRALQNLEVTVKDIHIRMEDSGFP